MNMNTDTTPRTDAVLHSSGHFYTLVDLARKLERELHAAHSEVARLMTMAGEQELTASLLVEENQRLTATNVQREARDRL